MKFSQRLGKKPIKVEIQIDGMDDELRNSLWNAFSQFFFNEIGSDYISNTGFDAFFTSMWADFFKSPIDEMDDRVVSLYDTLRHRFFEWKWYEVYDFLEFVSQPIFTIPVNLLLFQEFCNSMLERELSGFRFVDGLITPITDENELREIEEAINQTPETKLSGVHLHLKTALTKLSNRKSPDYRNSIKESISAVESIAQIISQKPKSGLRHALEVIEQKVGLHGSLREGFVKIYGYTSDEGGIRHAMSEESKVDFEDAKYMLVSCSAFVNYLIMKSDKAGIKF